MLSLVKWTHLSEIQRVRTRATLLRPGVALNYTTIVGFIIKTISDPPTKKAVDTRSSSP